MKPENHDISHLVDRSSKSSPSSKGHFTRNRREDIPSGHRGSVQPFILPRPCRSQSRQDEAVRKVEAYLRTATLKICQAANDGNFAHVASKHYSERCGGFHSMDTEQWSNMHQGEGVVAQIENFLKANPSFRTIVEDISVDINKKLDRAIVWVVRTDSGLEDGLRREAVLRMTWTRIDEVWLCTDSSGIRAFPYFTVDDTLGGGGILP